MMFSKAIAEAKEYTRAVVILYRMTDGRVESNVGTYVHLDDVGHILTASHIFKMGSEDPVSKITVIFDGRYFNADYIADDVPNDILVMKIQDYQPGLIKIFPKFLDESIGELPRGTPLIRLGYPTGKPHSHIPVSWDDGRNAFSLGNDLKVNCFHNDGVVLRYVNRGCEVRLIEIASPALLGQSGGPVLTPEGIVVGLQSRNTVLEFSDRPPMETGLATSHAAIARFIKIHVPKYGEIPEYLK